MAANQHPWIEEITLADIRTLLPELVDSNELLVDRFTVMNGSTIEEASEAKIRECLEDVYGKVMRAFNWSGGYLAFLDRNWRFMKPFAFGSLKVKEYERTEHLNYVSKVDESMLFDDAEIPTKREPYMGLAPYLFYLRSREARRREKAERPDKYFGLSLFESDVLGDDSIFRKPSFHKDAQSVIATPCQTDGEYIGFMVIHVKDKVQERAERQRLCALNEIIVNHTFSRLLHAIYERNRGRLDGFFLRKEVDWELVEEPPKRLPVLNKTGMYDEIELYLDKGEIFSLVFFDLDHFRNINDILGHQNADIVLRYVAEAALEGLGEKNSRFAGRDCLCRFGGDEFVLVLPGQNEQQALDKAVIVRRKIKELGAFLEDAFRKIAEKDGKTLFNIPIGTSMGVFEVPTNAKGEEKMDARKVIDISNEQTQKEVKRTKRGGILCYSQRDKLTKAVNGVLYLNG